MSSSRAGSCGSVTAVAVSAPAWAWDRHGGEGLIVLLLHVVSWAYMHENAHSQVACLTCTLDYQHKVHVLHA